MKCADFLRSFTNQDLRLLIIGTVLSVLTQAAALAFFSLAHTAYKDNPTDVPFYKSYTFVWLFTALAVVIYIELLSFITKQGVYRFVYIFYPLTILPFLRFDDITSGRYQFYFIPFSILVLFYIFGSFHRQSHIISYFVNLFSRAAFAVGYILWIVLLESLSPFL